MSSLESGTIDYDGERFVAYSDEYADGTEAVEPYVEYTQYLGDELFSDDDLQQLLAEEAERGAN